MGEGLNVQMVMQHLQHLALGERSLDLLAGRPLLRVVMVKKVKVEKAKSDKSSCKKLGLVT